MSDPVYVQPFSMVVSSGVVVKAADTTDPEGPWIAHGPVAPDGPDYDKEILTKAGIDTGLPMWRDLGHHVDYDHMYPKTKNPKWIIGKGLDSTGPDGRPWIETTLFKGKEIAKEAWQHLNEGGNMGYSIYGLWKKRDARDRSRIIETEIHFVTMSPAPKGFGNRVKVGPMTSPMTLAKAAVLEIESGAFVDTWIPMDADTDFDCAQYMLLDPARQAEIVKAMTCGSRLEKAAARAQVETQKRCPDCQTKNRRSREKCRKCGRSFTDCCPSCGACQERGDDGQCNRCGKSSVEKALTTGSGGVSDSDTGGRSLRKQTMLPQARCPGCHSKNRLERSTCRRCGKPMPIQKGVSLSDTFRALGAADPEGLARVLSPRA